MKTTNSKPITIQHECGYCSGTGVYSGFGECPEAAVVCRYCDGTGCTNYTFTAFTGRKTKKGIKRVYKWNPGIGIGPSKEKGLTLESFGGMPYKDWAAGKPFPPKSEMRAFICPKWDDQSRKEMNAVCDKHMSACGRFDDCKRFGNKELCWEYWDSINKNK